MSGNPNKQELVFSREALRAIDRDAVEEFRIPSIVLMENAARGATQAIIRNMAEFASGVIVVVCGRGNNGGDGYAVARHLVNHGLAVRILAIGIPYTTDAEKNAWIATHMGIPVTPWSDSTFSNASLVIDAVFGTGLDRNVKDIYADAINRMNELVVPRVALDIPSGLDCDSGTPLGCCVEANLTISFVGPKLGYSVKRSARYTGKIIVTDIGCPQSLLWKYGTPLT